MKKVTLVPTLVVGGIGIVFGILFALLVGVIFDVILIVCGVLTLLSAIPQLISAVKGIADKQKIAIFDLVTSIVMIAVGIMLVFYRNMVIMLIIGAYLVAFPLFRTLIVRNKLDQLKRELPSMILGVVLMLVAPGFLLGVLGTVAGGVIILLSVIYMVVGVLAYFKAKKILESTDGPRIFVDTDGNGTVDTVYVDTTNDGVCDTEIKIKED